MNLDMIIGNIRMLGKWLNKPKEFGYPTLHGILSGRFVSQKLGNSADEIAETLKIFGFKGKQSAQKDPLVRFIKKLCLIEDMDLRLYEEKLSLFTKQGTIIDSIEIDNELIKKYISKFDCGEYEFLLEK